MAGVGDAGKLLDAVAAVSPDLAIIDVRMPPAHRDEGLRAAIEIRRRWPLVALLVLSQFVEERYASELLAGRPVERRHRRHAHHHDECRGEARGQYLRQA